MSNKFTLSHSARRIGKCQSCLCQPFFYLTESLTVTSYCYGAVNNDALLSAASILNTVQSGVFYVIDCIGENGREFSSASRMQEKRRNTRETYTRRLSSASNIMKSYLGAQTFSLHINEANTSDLRKSYFGVYTAGSQPKTENKWKCIKKSFMLRI
ncbi:hypothetical protein DMN91_003225 [Ooceraea biroi]|uniref:Uncharacterized protein n=1 Tax=Ooceraea biroi TaxID=2015173 RepID=A0A3L8DY33_OOCBI|nr:hypothetical protein DMN91_003225 [Ooceraea biroi]